ncbi:MAG: glycoside hydrolase family 31 protein [Myxococcota bacterium]
MRSLVVALASLASSLAPLAATAPTAAVAVLVAASASACGDDAPAPVATGPTFTATVADDGAIVLARDGATLTRLAADAVTVGAVDDPSIVDEWNWDPWWLDSDDPLAALAEVPPGLRFGRPADLGLTLATSVEAVDGQRFHIRLVPDAASARRIVYMKVSLDLAPASDGKRLYGASSMQRHVQLRGLASANRQLEADTTRRRCTTSATWPCRWRCRHAAGPSTSPRARAGLRRRARRPDAPRHHRQRRTRGRRGPRLWLFAAPTPLDLLLPYYRTTSFPRVPPEWGFGPWYWRNEIAGQAAVQGDLATLRAEHLPASAYWIDRPYASALQTFDFDPARYADPPAMLQAARAAGFRVAVWHTPYATPQAAETHAAVVAGGFFPPTQGIALNTFGSAPLDLTNPAAVTYWQSRLGEYRALGVEGYKLDFAEDVVLGLPGARGNRWAFADGRDERSMHAAYSGLYHATYRATLADADQGGFILARAGHAGGQALLDAIWPGDLDASFEQAGDDGAVGGIPAALATHLSLSASGYPFFAADTGGYRHGPPDSEAYRRWFEMTAVTCVMEIGGADNQVPWERERWGWDATLLDDFRRYASLHIRLFPYARALAEAIAQTGRPPVRPFGLEHPELGLDPDDVYFFGPDLLVAPVVARGVTSRAVPFPAGRWVDWWDGSVRDVAVAGPIDVPAPLGRLPLFLRAGAIVPLLDPAIETLAPADGSRVGGKLWVRVVPGPAESSLTLGDGTRLTVTPRADGSLHLDARGGSRWGPELVWQVMGDGRIRDVPATTASAIDVPP